MFCSSVRISLITIFLLVEMVKMFRLRVEDMAIVIAIVTSDFVVVQGKYMF